MIIKEIDNSLDNRRYEVYEEIKMNTTDGQSVTVLQLIRTVSRDEINNKINILQNQISNLNQELAKEQEILSKIGE